MTSTETTVKPKNSLAIASLALGLLTIVIHIVFGVNGSGCVGGIAVLCGIISLLQIRKGTSTGKAAAIIGILLGCLPFLITLISILLLVPTR